MFDSITSTGVVTYAGQWIGEIYPVILVVIGFGVTLVLANWAVAKFRG